MVYLYSGVTSKKNKKTKKKDSIKHNGNITNDNKTNHQWLIAKFSLVPMAMSLYTVWNVPTAFALKSAAAERVSV